MQRKVILSILILTAAGYAGAQSTDSLKNKNQSLPADSSANLLSLFQLVDSLMAMPMEDLELGSTIVGRIGYNSNIIAASRTLGFSQFGLSPSITYYHKSGLYLDATAYWSQQYSPNLYLAIPSAGYIKTLKKWTFNLEYSRYVFSYSDSLHNPPYKNTLSFSNFFEVKPLLFRLDYSLYFGDKSVHRIMPSLMVNFQKRNWKGFKRILFYPTFSVLLGNEKWSATQYIPNFNTVSEFLYLLNHHLPRYHVETKSYNKFGVLNYSFSLPLSVSFRTWNFLLSYTYNLQRALPEEPLTVNNSGYVSFSIIRYFNFKSNSVLTDLLKMTK